MGDQRRWGDFVLYSVIMKETIRSLLPLYIFAGVQGCIPLTACVYKTLYVSLCVCERREWSDICL